MSRLPRSHLVVRHLRMLLVSAGLREDDADALLDRLADEFAAGRLEDQDARLRFIEIERELRELTEAQRRSPGRVEVALTGTATGIVSALLYDFLKSQIGIDKPTAAVQPAEEDWENVIQSEWGITKEDDSQLEPALRRALQVRQARHGTLEKKVAVLLDGIGMVLDARGSHLEAGRVRRQALKISRRVNGPLHEGTGAALSNLGLCLFGQGRYAESDQFLAKSCRVLLDCVGQEH
jgi:tetratricopeptide repeat protein